MRLDRGKRLLICEDDTRIKLSDTMLLYGVTDRHWLDGETLCSQVRKAIKGGTTFIQLREKDLGYEDFYKEALEIKALCSSNHIPFVINDNVRLAIEADADGVHVGQSDMKTSDVRKMTGPDKIIGVSVQTVEQAISAEEAGADYLGVGAVFATNSKADATDVSLSTLNDICKAVKIPVVAIGGITGENVSKLFDSGIAGVAVISAIFGKADITAAAADLKKKLMTGLMNHDKGRNF